MSPEECEKVKERVIEALALIDQTQPLGTKLFNAIARVTVTVGMETVALRWGTSGRDAEVFLVQRDPCDSAYPGMWHLPGSIMRPGEMIEDVFKRLEEKEYGGALYGHLFVENYNDLGEARGHFFTPVYFVRFDGANGGPMGGRWFPVHSLPQPIVPKHRDIIIPRVTARAEELLNIDFR